MKNKAESFILNNALLTDSDKVIVALSGGADSVSLLHFLISIKEKYNLTVYAAHLNHNLRGEESQRDENFVRTLCEKYGVELFVKSVDIGKIAEENKIGEELCGRYERYNFFDELSKKLGAKVATAHNASDNAETVLFNLCRGSSVKGVCGIPVKRGNIIRPLLCVTREEIESYCKENNLEYVTDSTNLCDDYNRNKIRHNAMPVFREINEDFENAVLRFCSSMTDIYEYLSEISEKELKLAKTEYGYSCEKLLSFDKAVLKFALMKLIKESGADAQTIHIELIISAMETGGSVNLQNGFTCVCSQKTLRIVKENEEAEDFEYPFNSFKEIKYFSKEELKNVHNMFANDLIDCDIITDETVVRHKRAGDTFTLPNRKVTKPFRKLLIEMKIPKEIRNNLLVVANGSTVLWAERVGVSLQGKISPNTKRAVKILKNNEDKGDFDFA